MEKLLRIIRDTLLIYCRDFMTTDCLLIKKKFEFSKTEVEHLGHRIGNDKVKMDPTKVAIIAEWTVPTSVK